MLNGAAASIYINGQEWKISGSG